MLYSGVSRLLLYTFSKVRRYVDGHECYQDRSYTGYARPGKLDLGACRIYGGSEQRISLEPAVYMEASEQRTSSNICETQDRQRMACSKMKWVLRLALLFAGICFFRLLCNTYSSRRRLASTLSQETEPLSEPSRKALIVASLQDDDTTWLAKHLTDWETFVYVVDNPTANLTVALNKGREANVYLTYLIDHYERLPHYMVFLHSLRYQWHNEDPLYGRSHLRITSWQHDLGNIAATSPISR